jgi:hypothetical protein
MFRAAKLATKTLPLATVGTMLALELPRGQEPATDEKIGVVPPEASKAYSVTLAGAAVLVGRPTAQMIADPADVRFDEIVVKKPPSWPDAMLGNDFSSCSCAGFAGTFHTLMLLPPLLTTRRTPSDPIKYDGPHQQEPKSAMESALPESL